MFPRPPREEMILANPGMEVVITFAVALPILPTTLLLSPPSPLKVSFIPLPKEPIIWLPPLAREEIVSPRIIPIPETMSPSPVVRKVSRSSRLFLFLANRDKRDVRDGALSS